MFKVFNAVDLNSIQTEVAKDVQNFMDNPCPECGGTGRVKLFENVVLLAGRPSRMDVSSPCKLCGGTGVYKKG